MKQWKIAQIGCGAMAAVHAAQIAELPNAQLTLAVDLNPDRAKEFAASEKRTIQLPLGS